MPHASVWLFPLKDQRPLYLAYNSALAFRDISITFVNHCLLLQIQTQDQKKQTVVERTCRNDRVDLHTHPGARILLRIFWVLRIQIRYKLVAVHDLFPRVQINARGIVGGRKTVSVHSHGDRRFDTKIL